MNRVTLSWENWHAVVDVLRAKELPSVREHADGIERPFEGFAADICVPTKGARWQPGIPLPVE